MKKITFYLFSLLVVCSLLLYSCGETTKKEKAEDIVVSEDINKLVYPIPTPFEVTQMLKKAGTSYGATFTNSTEKASQYFTEKSKALNLGIYGADLSYSSTFNVTQETRKFLDVTKKLTTDLGLVSVLDETFLKRVEANIENEDSLYKIVTESYYKTFNQLSTSNKGAVAMLVLTGGWVETIYLSCQMAIISKDNTEILKGLATQKTTASRLFPLLQTYKDNADVSEMITEITKLKDIFAQVQEVNDELVMTPEQFKNLSKIVEEIRTKIINLS